MKPTVHLICNAHLDPVWQWRWEEGASEALATFRNAVEILRDYSDFIFCHNEAVLYRWVEDLDPPLFRRIRKLVEAGRWVISGGWFIQPDVNLPGTEALIRHNAEGRIYFLEKFGARPIVAYNFDSFGHSGGLPQILRRAGFEMYIHMRPQRHELELPSDLYRWRGVDGTVIPAYRIAVGLYHTERDNIEDRLREGVESALSLGRDVPIFWGLGNHGGGATREDLEKIASFIGREDRVRIRHSSPDLFFAAVRSAVRAAPLFEGDLQRSFTGCYTSLSRLKRKAQSSLGGLSRSEALCAAAWWLRGERYPVRELREAWRDHLFNDFHDILTGSCVEPAEHDALGLYGKVEDGTRRLELKAASAFSRGRRRSFSLPLTVAYSNPAALRVPVVFECMADYRPFWKGRRHLRLFRNDGTEIICQEEPPEALLPFNEWRRRISFLDRLPAIGVSRYYLEAHENSPECEAGKPTTEGGLPPAGKSALVCSLDGEKGWPTSLKASPSGLEFLQGPLLEAIVIEDTADSWGSGRGRYRKVAGRFAAAGRPVVLSAGPVRTITQSVFSFGKSRIVMNLVSYADWPVLEFGFRVTWNEERRRLKLCIPTRLKYSSVLCEVPGGAIRRPSDGEEHVQGRWLLAEGTLAGKAAAIGVVNSGQHGFDSRDGEVRFSVLRCSAYCHERGIKIGKIPARKYADLGTHDFKILVTAGDPAEVGTVLPGLADYLSAPPAAFPHLPINVKSSMTELLGVLPATVRLLACKQSWDGKALIVRLQEAAGHRARTRLRTEIPALDVPLVFRPFEIKTLRLEKSGTLREVPMIEEADSR